MLVDLEGESIIAIAVQIVGWFLIVSSALVFIKHPMMRSMGYILDINILISSAGFLLGDWALSIPGPLGCELFTFSFLGFGVAGTYTTTAIAIERYRKMMRMSTALPERKRQLLQVIIVWFLSFALMVYPVIQRFMDISIQESAIEDTETDFNTLGNAGQAAADDLCLFTYSRFFTIHISLIVLYVLFAVWGPALIMLFCYARIFKHVRTARINRWMNHMAAQRSRQTTVIKCHGRKANVFQISSSPITAPTERYTDIIASSRERNILFKGIFSGFLVLVTWVPCTTFFIYNVYNGFQIHLAKYMSYAIVLTKLAVPMTILHYICLNIRYKKMYLQTLMVPFKNILPTYYSEFMENTSVLESQMAPTSLYREAIMTTRTPGIPALAPITEPAGSCISNISVPNTPSAVSKRPVSGVKTFRKVLQRTKSMPMCLKRGVAVMPSGLKR